MSSRRNFLNWFLTTSWGALAASVLYPVARFLSPPATTEAATHEVEAGVTNDPEFIERGFKIVRFGNDPVIVLRVDDQEFRAFSATCTHLDCIVEYQRDKHRIWCNCHNGEYDLQGRQVAGPPPRPLEPFTVHLEAKAPGQPSTVVVSKA